MTIGATTDVSRTAVVSTAGRAVATPAPNANLQRRRLLDIRDLDATSNLFAIVIAAVVNADV